MERCKLPSGVWGEAAADKRFGAYWSQKVQLGWQQFLLIFLRTNVIFCTKQAGYRTAGPIVHRATPYQEFLSWGSRRHCPMQVGAYEIGPQVLTTMSSRGRMRRKSRCPLLNHVENTPLVDRAMNLVLTTMSSRGRMSRRSANVAVS